MGSISDYLEDKLLDHVMKVTAFTVPTNLFIALSTADPTDDGSGIAEPAGGAGYARIVSNTWEAAAARATENTNQIDWANASASWGNLSHWAIFDTVTGGNMLAHGAFGAAKTVGIGDAAKVLAGEIDITISSGGVSNYLAHKLIDHVFKTAAFTVPTNLFVAAIITTNVVDADTGTTITEPNNDGDGYERKQENANWNAAVDGLLTNTTTITFPTATLNWDTIIDMAIVDAVILGNLLFYGAVGIQKVVDVGDTLEVVAEGFDITMD